MTNEKKWFDDLPKPKSTPQQVSVSELHQLITNNAQVVVVDVRRADIEVSPSFAYVSLRISLHYHA